MTSFLVLLVLLYTTTSVNGCGHFTGSFGTITSPDFPLIYPNYINCQWVIEVAQNMTVAITFSSYQLEGCPYDYIRIFDGPSILYGMLVEICTDPAVPVTIRSSGNFMTIHMVSDYAYTLAGFKAIYESEHIVGCGGNFTDNNGTITSPGYPNQYIFMLQCIWYIQVEAGYNISITFTDLDIEFSHLCHYDYLDIHDGPDETHWIVGTYCGSIIPEPIYSSSNTMALSMVTDARISGRGFSLYFEAHNNSKSSVELDPIIVPESNVNGLSYDVAMVNFLLMCHVAMLAM